MRPIPPAGVEVPAQDRTELENGLKRLKAAIDKLGNHPLLPDVMIYHEAVRYALQYNEFFKLEEVFKKQSTSQNRQQGFGMGGSGFSERGIKELITKTVDDGDFFGLQPENAKNIVIGFGRMEG